MGRAARNVEGMVILYADRDDRTPCRRAIGETSRRRERQAEYNGSTASRPRASRKASTSCSPRVYEIDYVAVPEVAEEPEERYRSLDDIEGEIKSLEKKMREAAKALEFERAGELRDRIKQLRAREFGLK